MPLGTLYAARNIDFAPTINVDYAGDPLPLTGATVSLQVRLYPGATGPAIAEHAAVPFADDTHPTGDGWRRLALSPEIDKAILASLPGLNTPTPGDAQTFAHEIKITYADGMQDSVLIGDFILYAGVNYA